MQPPFLPETRDSRTTRTSGSNDVSVRSGTVIAFPTTAPFDEPRKRGAQSGAEMKRSIVSYLPALIDEVSLDIVRSWRRQVPIAWLAKIHQLTVRQVEAVLWVATHGHATPAGPLAAPTVRESRGLHIVARKAA